MPEPQSPEVAREKRILATASFAAVCVAVAMMVPALVALFVAGSDPFWPGWVSTLWILSFPVGLLALILILVTRRETRRANGGLGGAWMAEAALVIAIMGAGVNAFLFMLLVAMGSGG